MTHSVIKAVQSAVLSAAVAIPALAAEITWNGDGNYDLGADDTMTFASDTIITASSKFTGSGKITVSGGTLTLAYKSEANSGNGVNLRVRSTSSFSGSGPQTRRL